MTDKLDEEKEERRKKVTLVVVSGDYEKLFAAFSIANGAAASNMDVIMFFAYWGLRALKKNVRTGKTLFARMLGILEGGDINKANPGKYGFLGLGRWMFKKMSRKKNISLPVELRQLAIELGVKMYSCEITTELLEIPKEQLIAEVDGTVGVGFMIEQAQQSDFTLFI